MASQGLASKLPAGCRLRRRSTPTTTVTRQPRQRDRDTGSSISPPHWRSNPRLEEDRKATHRLIQGAPAKQALASLEDLSGVTALRGYRRRRHYAVAHHPLWFRLLAHVSDRSWSVLVGRLCRHRAILSARALRRRRDVFLCGCGSGRVGVPLAQYLRPPVGLFAYFTAGRGLGWAYSQAERRYLGLWAAVLPRSACRADRHARRRPLTQSHHLRLRLLLDGPAVPAGLWFSERDVAGPRNVLANPRRQPLCEPDCRRDGPRLCHATYTRFHP